MRLSVVVSDAHPSGADPRSALSRDRELVASARDRVDGVTLQHRLGSMGSWDLQALTYASYLSSAADQLTVTVRRLPLGVLNPIELAEQLATVDHACKGRFAASVIIGPERMFRIYGLDPSVGIARFEEALGLVRRMWAGEPFEGDGPHFRFGEARPTLLTFQPGGPPLSLEVDDMAQATSAARYGLGLHLVGHVARVEAVARYHAAGGAGSMSSELDFDQATADKLGALRQDGFEQVDVRLRRPTDPPTSLVPRLDELAGRARLASRD